MFPLMTRRRFLCGSIQVRIMKHIVTHWDLETRSKTMLRSPQNHIEGFHIERVSKPCPELNRVDRFVAGCDFVPRRRVATTRVCGRAGRLCRAPAVACIAPDGLKSRARSTRIAVIRAPACAFLGLLPAPLLNFGVVAAQ